MIIGLTGTLGAGKGSVADILVQHYGFEKIVFSDWLKKEMKKKGFELTRRGIQDFADGLRKEFGQQALADKVIEMIEPGKNYAVDGFRNPGEVEAFRKMDDFVLIGLDAPLSLRSERMILRGRADDPKNKDDFLKMDARDKGIGQEEYGQQSVACYEMADRYLLNDRSFEELMAQVKEMMEELGC